MFLRTNCFKVFDFHNGLYETYVTIIKSLYEWTAIELRVYLSCKVDLITYTETKTHCNKTPKLQVYLLSKGLKQNTYRN